MKQSGRNLKHARSFFARMGGAVGLLITLGLLIVVPASATYETVGTFDGKGARAMAVNISGAGGVPAGTVYSVGTNGSGVSRYSAKGEFLGSWADGLSAEGVAVDQATGNVYVLRTQVQHGVVQVFSADGSQLIASFGELGTQGGPGESIDESPEKIHWVVYPNAIAVDNSGVVYVSDLTYNFFEHQNRVMLFKPQSPGDYEHYVYAGQADDIASGFGPTNPVLDSAGNLYTLGGVGILEFAPGEPSAPVCEYELSAGGILGMTVNPESGEVFYFSYKDKKIHQLNSCNSQGEFVESTAFAPVPKTGNMETLAFNPTLTYEASRPAGVLYGVSGEGLGYIFASPEVRLPVVESESVSFVTSSTATLGAQINPKGSETRYVFQYITDAAYQANEPTERFVGATEAPLGGAVLGSGQAPLSAGVALVGLQPDTEYHYRAIATSHCDPEKEEELCEDTGPAQVFRTFPVEAPGLPDGRAYELVSPAQKNGGEVLPADPGAASCNHCKPGTVNVNHFPMLSAPDGEAVAYEGLPFSFTEGAAKENEYLSRRTASGWQTTVLSPYLGGSGTDRGTDQGYKAFNVELTRGLLYQINPTLSPEAPAGYANLYTQDTANPSALTPLLKTEPPNRAPRLTYAGASADFSQFFFEADDALTGETPFAPEAVDGGQEKNNLYESAGDQLRLVNVLPGNAETAPGAVFGSGERLGVGSLGVRPADYSHAISDDGSRAFWSDEAGQVYVRENGESTRAIPDLPGIPDPGKFLSASADGSQVLLSNGHIYDLETEEIIDLTEGEGGFQGITGQSEDLSRIYFVDTAVLTGEEENDQGAKAQSGKYNLYAWHEGAVDFVATLDPGDNPTASGGPAAGDWMASPSQRSAEASPNGRWVAFLSKAPLTGYDNAGCGGLCLEVFLYDSATQELICASCNPSGVRPLGRSILRLIDAADGSIPQPRYLTDEGRLYFDTQDSISPFDTNNGVEDVYQYEPEGVGKPPCKRKGGCVSLISAGHEPVDSNFLAADQTGKNIFFTTRDQLVLKDRDDLIDLYVAREDGGIPAETETARGECQGEACQPPAVVPNDPTPASSSFEGRGNVVEKKATKKKAKAQRKKRKQHAKKGRNRLAHGRAAKHNRGGVK